ncbi:hypothetical protein FHX37_2153 [Haloactinospora alba]|uniref:Uncharacterized protein n=1 Tax=Haloactinospora alba TaxID=405555 RepID=A0A543NK85_9ACTN|nr:hypothetical protein [Haloactinospora alba]TQN32204.1 hypothetical protein FHX37_2153 [Haloactinospora alba]
MTQPTPPGIHNNDRDGGADTAPRLDQLRALLETAKPGEAREAVRELVQLSAPGDGGEALKLAARFTNKDKYASKLLLRLWSTARDSDGFAEHLLAPVFRHEGRTELRLSEITSLTGLRHLTMLTKLHLDWCRRITDVTEVDELTGLSGLGRLPAEHIDPPPHGDPGLAQLPSGMPRVDGTNP